PRVRIVHETRTGEVLIGVTEVEVRERKGGGYVTATFGVAIIPSGQSLSALDLMELEETDKAGVLTKHTFYRATNAEPLATDVLERGGQGKYKLTGTRDGKELDEIFTTHVDLSNLYAKRKEIARAARKKGARVTYAGYIAGAHPAPSIRYEGQ